MGRTEVVEFLESVPSKVRHGLASAFYGLDNIQSKW